MKFSSFIRVAAAATAALAILSFASSNARAITYGQEDCEDNATNLNCLHTNVVSLSGFREPNEGEGEDLVSFGRCSGSLLYKDEARIVILTAGHCSSGYLEDLQSGAIVDVGVSFDALIERDVSQENARWSPAQYILGGLPVLTADYGRGVNTSVLQFDYGIVVFEAPFVTDSGTPVDLSDVETVNLPSLNYLKPLVGRGKRALITAVGYGTGEAHNKPGEGGNQGGAVNSLDELGVRMYTDLTLAFSFKGVERNILTGSQNPARGHEGTCGGDSGGPLFHENAAGEEIQVGITSAGDAICRATSVIARTDAGRVQEFLHCVLDGAESGDLQAIEDCGCIEVNSKGVCP